MSAYENSIEHMAVHPISWTLLGYRNCDGTIVVIDPRPVE